jgi:hypothetical protein
MRDRRPFFTREADQVVVTAVFAAAGVTRVTFGPGPYGVSQSWFFDQHHYVGLPDDMDFGIKYVTQRGNWDLSLAYFYSSEGNWRGTSEAKTAPATAMTR